MSWNVLSASQCLLHLYESSTMRFILGAMWTVEVNAMAPVGLLFLGLVIRSIFGAALVIAVVWLLFKLAKLADAYTQKLQSSKR